MADIKERIGQRIYSERQAKGLTRKALAALTDGLKPSRINNWERGTRTPGPGEIMQLARALEISPGYLMCLTDDKEVQKELPWLGSLVPLLNEKQACNPALYIRSIIDEVEEPEAFVPLSIEHSDGLGDLAFALRVQDDSMAPELSAGDVVVIDPNKDIKPGSLVVAKLHDSSEVIIRRYKQLSANQPMQEYELVVNDDNWANITTSQSLGNKLVGVVCTLIRNI